MDLLTGLIMGAVLGFVSGIAPGPFTTFVAVTALEDGLRATFRLAFVPLVTEGPPLLLATIFLTQVPRGALQWIGFVGGVLIAYLGYRVFRGADKEGSATQRKSGFSGHFWGIALTMLLSPSPWIFWLIIGAPLFLNQWHQGPLAGGLFLLSFLSFLIGSQMAIAWGASSGRGLSRQLQRRLIRVAGIGLVVGGMFLMWISYQGDFAGLVSPQRTVQQAVESELG